MKTTPLSAWLMLILLAFIWGCTFLLMKKALVVYTSTEVGGGRLFFAFLVLAPLCVKYKNMVPKSKYPYLFLSALCGYIVPAFLFAVAGKHIDSALSGILTSLTPLFTFVIGVTFFHQPKRIYQVIGILLGLLGAFLIIISRNTGQFNLGNPFPFLVMAATLLYGINVNIVSRYLNSLPALASASFTFLFIGPISLCILLTTDFFGKMANPANLTNSLYILALGLFSSGLGVILYNRMIQLASGIFASSVTYLMPVVAILLGFLDGERLQFQHLVGMGIILSGIYLVNKK